MILTIHVIGLLSVLAAAVFGAAGISPAATKAGRSTWFVPAAGFLVAWPVASEVDGADPTAAGAIAAAVAAAALFRRPPPYVVSLAGGAAAALWGRYLEDLGLPAWFAIPVAVAVTAVAIWLSVVRPVFAPVRLREEGLLLVLALGLAVAFLPELVVGWQSASALNVGSLQDPLAAGQPAAWALGAAAAAAGAGGLAAAWRRRTLAVAGRRRR